MRKLLQFNNISLKHVSVNKTSQHKKDKTNIFRRPSLNDKYLVCAKIRQEIRQIDLNQERMFSEKQSNFNAVFCHLIC